MTFASHNDDERNEIKTTKQKQINNKHNLCNPDSLDDTFFTHIRTIYNNIYYYVDVDKREHTFFFMDCENK